jgi:TolA-binding protein
MAPVRSRRPFSVRRPGWMLGVALLAIGPMAAPPVLAQSQEETRIRKLEQEVRALQRKVFPGGDGRYFEPQVTAPAPTVNPQNQASTGPVTDLLARMDAVEAALSQLTAQTEVNTNSITQLTGRVAGLEAARQAAVPATTVYAEELTQTPPPGSGTTAPAPASATPLTAGTTAAVERPQTGDAADDAYVYGYRLWEAGRHQEARSQLEAMLKQHPRHRRASWARNLIGRSYLDQNQPRPAAEWFLKNYLEDRDGERAPDSLVYLASATLQLGNKAKACEAVEEFRLVYPTEASGRLASVVTPVARGAGCN